jgi:hypothetical protein
MPDTVSFDNQVLFEMQKERIAHFCIVVISLTVLVCATSVAKENTSPAKVSEYERFDPLIPVGNEYTFNEYWLGRKIGPKDFYMADQGPYLRIREEGVEKLKQVGLYDRTIPGHINYSFIKYFLPDQRRKMTSLPQKRMIERIIENKWPIHTLFYCRLGGNPPPSDRLLDIINDQWIGDGQPETVYRLEPVFHYLKTAKRWNGSSMYLWDETQAANFFEHELLPELEKPLPFIRDLDHNWTRPELRTLSDIYCEKFYEPVKRPIAYGMYVGNYHLATLKDTVAIAEKGSDSLSNARAKGMMCQAGGNKFYFIWGSQGPIQMYGYFTRAWNSIRGDAWGIPLPLVNYYIFRPFLIGANQYMNETMPLSCIQDLEGDGQYELSTLGHIVKDMLDYADRHPDRGVTYTPVGLMIDYNRAFGNFKGTTYFGYNIENDDADYMNAALIEMLFPQPDHIRLAGPYVRSAPYGEIFNILQPNIPDQGADPKVLENYKILFALGGMEFDDDFSKKVKNHVKQGGTLVLNAPDITTSLDENFLGFILGKKNTHVKSEKIKCSICSHSNEEEDFMLYDASLTSAEICFSDQKARPVVVRNQYGKGYVITILSNYALGNEVKLVDWLHGRHKKKELLNFFPHFLEHLFSGLTPFEVGLKPEDRQDMSWLISKKGKGWLVTLFNYSCAREPIVSKTFGTAKVHAEYPLKEVPFQITCSSQIEDVVELYGDRDVNWKKIADQAVVSETMHGGEIRVYEFQPQKIDLGRRKKYINYALNQPVIASSNRKDFKPECAVDGDLNTQWWSDTDPKRHNTFEMPQKIQVYLGQPKEIDHVFIKFHDWKHQSLKTRLRVYKYIVEASLDGRKWKTIIDESKNEDNTDTHGLERWFDPVKASYVRLTVLRNSAFSGARLDEIKVMGKQTQEYQLQRKPLLN